MKWRLVAAMMSALLLLNLPLFGWDGVGHMAVAYVAYQKLTPPAKSRVGVLLKLNPYYPQWVKEIPAGTSQQDEDMVLFMLAATWPDQIKRDPKYKADGAPKSHGDRPDGPDSGRNIGYKDMYQHRYWHFVDTPFSTDGTKLPSIPEPDAQTQIAAFRAVLASSAGDDLKSYDLVWPLHLVGDVHQPLHCATRVSKTEPGGDAGGNDVELTCSDCNGATELHAFWDNILGQGSDPSVALSVAKKLAAPDPSTANNIDTTKWIQESFADAETEVYVTPIGQGDGPFPMTATYKDAAWQLGSERIAMAGARFANVINAELK